MILSVDGDGRITGVDATEFLALSQLTKPELKQVRWHAVISLNYLLACLIYIIMIKKTLYK